MRCVKVLKGQRRATRGKTRAREEGAKYNKLVQELARVRFLLSLLPVPLFPFVEVLI